MVLVGDNGTLDVELNNGLYQFSTELSNGEPGVSQIRLYTHNGNNVLNAASASQSDVQTVTIGAASGTWSLSLTIGGQTATLNGLAYNVAPATLQTMLQGLPGIRSGNVLVSGSAGSSYVLAFTNALADTFIPTATVSGTALPSIAHTIIGFGVPIKYYEGSGADTLTGSTGTNDFILPDVDPPASITGQGTSTLHGGTGTNTWIISGPDSGTVDGITFTGVANLVGSPGDDVFEFQPGGSLSGSIESTSGGSYTLDYSQLTTAVAVNLGSGTVTGVAGTIANVGTFIGGSGSNTLTGSNSNNAWQITGNNAGTVDGVSFTGFGNLVGGTDNDTFTFSDGASVNGSITGGSGSDSLNYAAYSTPVNVTLAGPGSGSATGVGGGFSNIESFTGGSAVNTVTGPNGTNAWDITGANAGTVNGNSFSAFANLVGGTGNDTFTFSNGASVSGSINGGGGTDILNDAVYTTPVSVSLTEQSDVQTVTFGASSGTWSLSLTLGGQTFTLSDLAIDIPLGTLEAGLQGLAGIGTGNVTVGGTPGSSYTLSFDGALANTFIPLGSVSGTADPEIVHTAIAVAPNSGQATGIAEGFSNIESFVGGSGANTFTGANIASTWQISGANAGSVGDSTFTAFRNLVGGSANNTFTFANGGSVSGSINGAAGSNTLDYSALTTAISVNLATNTATAVGGGFSNIQTFNGGSGTNTLTGANTPNAWQITANNGGNINGTVNFASFADLVGGTGNDTFSFANGVSVSGTINGGGGADTLDLSAYTTPVSVNLAAATATAVVGGFSNIENFNGGSGSNTLSGPNGTVAWSVTHTNTGTVGSDTFSGFENLVGGTGNDTFSFADGKYVSGTINGGTGSNALNYAQYNIAASVNLATCATTGAHGGFSNIQNFVGGSDSTLIGANTVNTWNITGTNTGNVNGSVPFSSFENLVGGTSNDTFVFSNGAAVTGTITGGSGSDTLNYAAYTTPVSVNLTTGATTGAAGGFSNVANFVGGSGSDTLTGPTTGTANSWEITSSNAGTVDGSYTFKSFENLADGGANGDTFSFRNGISIAGTLVGGGNDTLNYSAWTTPVSTNFATGATTAVGGGFSGIDNVIGGSALNTLTGPATANAWSITAANAGAINGTITFTGFGNLVGGGVSDTFKLSNGATITGTLAGGGGSGTLDESAYQTPVDVNLAAGTATAIGGGVSGIGDFVGDSANNTLTGANAAAIWNITGTNAGTVSGTAFSSFENLVGGSGGNTFAFLGEATISGSIAGGSGNNALDYSGYATAVTVNLLAEQATGDAGGFSNIQSFVGSPTGGTIDGPNTPTTWEITGTNAGTLNSKTSFASFDSLVGGSGGNNYVLAGGAITGSITGAGADTLTGANGENLWAITGPNQGAATGVDAFTGIGSLIGGSGDDTFTFSGSDPSLSGTINGGAGGNNTLDYSAYAGGIADANLQTGAATSVDGGAAGGVTNINRLVGAVNTANLSPPTSTVNALPSFSRPGFTVSWNGSDTSGYGISGYDLYVSENGGAYQLYLSQTSLTSITFPGQAYQSYRFYTIAYSNDGLVQTAAGPFATTTVAPAADHLVLKLPTPAYSGAKFTATVFAQDPNGQTDPVASGSVALLVTARRHTVR